MFADPCLDQNIGNRRIFWTTRTNACGSYPLCGIDCAIPGLEYENPPGPDQGLPGEPGPRTIKTDDWLQGLILNILNTRARTDAKCPAPAAVYGHWSESYRDDNLYIGSTLLNAAEKSYRNNAEAERAVGNAVRADVNKLIVLGIATEVSVDTNSPKYGTVEIVILVTTVTGRSKINLSGSFVSETWVWH
jgi:hypothetical protein